MYNQFTALDQKPLPLGRIVLNPMQVPKANRKKKKKLHSKNPYKIKKIKIRGQQAMAEKFVDGLMLLKMLHIEHPKQIITANISYRKIVEINADHLEYFTSLVELNCSENYIPLQQLRKLPIVEHVNISHNQIKAFNLEMGGFKKLKKLNLSFNQVEYQFIPQLTLIENLVDLDLSYNDLQELPDNMDSFEKLKKLNLEGNKFKSDYKAANFWSSLATMPSLEILSVSRNKIRGIHTEKLAAGNFKMLQELDFSHNIVENQHNLICARNFTSLKKLYITGNPFVEANQYKGLEMEIFARTGAEVIVEKLNPHYLKAEKPQRPEIKFQKIVTIKTDIFHKKKNVLFGVQLPEDELFSNETDDEQEQQIQESESEDEEAMFMTQQINQHKRTKKSSKLQQNDPNNLDQIGESFDSSSNAMAENHHQIDNESNTDNSIINQNVDENSRYHQSRKHKIDGSESKSQVSYAARSELSEGKSSIEYGEFHKVAAELLGDEKQYKKSFDIHTSYKALKKALDRADEF